MKKDTMKTSSSLLALLISISPLAFADEGTKKKADRSPDTAFDSAETPAQAPESGSDFSTSATIYLASNYIFRGQTQTQNRAAIQGSFDVTHASGLGVGGFVSNVDIAFEATPTKTEADTYVTYNKTLGDHGFGAMAIWYNYVETPHWNAMEYSLYYRYSFAKLDAMWMPNYFGYDTESFYTRLSLNIPVTAKNGILLSAGHTSFDDDAKVSMKDYQDFKLGVTHTADQFNVEFSFTDTERKNTADVKQKDRALTVILSRSF